MEVCHYWNGKNILKIYLLRAEGVQSILRSRTTPAPFRCGGTRPHSATWRRGATPEGPEPRPGPAGTTLEPAGTIPGKGTAAFPWDACPEKRKPVFRFTCERAIPTEASLELGGRVRVCFWARKYASSKQEIRDCSLSIVQQHMEESLLYVLQNLHEENKNSQNQNVWAPFPPLESQHRNETFCSPVKPQGLRMALVTKTTLAPTFLLEFH